MNIKNKISELYLSTPENVTMVSYGFKFKNNEKTDEKCIVFGVKKKKPKSELKDVEIIPDIITIDEHQIKTDVIEVKDFRVNVCYNYIPVVGEPIGTGNPDNQIIPHRRKQRSIKGGVSTTNFTRNENLSIYSAGTLGAIVIDSVDGRMVGLSNNHVYVSNPFIASDRVSMSLGENVYQNITSQPADLDGGIIDMDSIGKVKRYLPLNLNQFNHIDAAITTLNTIDLDSYKILGLPNDYDYLDFATTAEIDNLLNLNPLVFKCARTTGPLGNTPSCVIKINQINVSASVGGYFNNGIENSVDFQDCISFSYENSYPGVTIQGDSGSVLVAMIGNSFKIIGLCFAGDPISNPIDPSVDGSIGLASRIDKVAELLEIEPWTPNKDIKLNSEDPSCSLVMPGRSSEKFIYFKGKKYYQIGTTNEKPTDTNC